MKKKRPIPQYEEPYTRKNHFLNTGFDMGFGNVQEIPFLDNMPDPLTQVHSHLEKPIDPDDFHTLFQNSVQDLVDMARPLDEPWQRRLIEDVSSVTQKQRSGNPGEFANSENVIFPYNPWSKTGQGQINLRQAKAALYYSAIPQIFAASAHQFREHKTDFLESFQLASTKIMEMINDWNPKWGSFSAATTRGAFFGITEGLREERAERLKGTIGGLDTAPGSFESAQGLGNKLDRSETNYEGVYSQSPTGYIPTQFEPDAGSKGPNVFGVKFTWDNYRKALEQASSLTGLRRGRSSDIPLKPEEHGAARINKVFNPVQMGGKYIYTESGYRKPVPTGQAYKHLQRSDDPKYMNFPGFVGGDDPNNIDAFGQPALEDDNYSDIATERVLRWSGKGQRPPENLVMDEPNFAAFPDTNNPINQHEVVSQGLSQLYRTKNPQVQYALWMSENFSGKGARVDNRNTVLRFGPWSKGDVPRPDVEFGRFLNYVSKGDLEDPGRMSVIRDYAKKTAVPVRGEHVARGMQKFFGMMGEMWSRGYNQARFQVEGITSSTEFKTFQENVSRKYSLANVGSHPNKIDVEKYWSNQNQLDLGYQPDIPPEYYAQEADLMAYDWQQRERGLRTPASQKFSPGYVRSIAKAPVEDVPGHEDIAIKVNTGKGETYIQDKIFTGPDWAEITPLTYAKATKLATKTGGHISGSYHSQPTGRSAKPSQQDKEGLGWLGDMEIQEEGYRRTKAEAPTRLWRGEFDPFYEFSEKAREARVNSPMKSIPEWHDRKEASGRWFAPTIEQASWYMHENNVGYSGGEEHIGGVLSYLDVDDPEKYLVANSDDPKVRRFSLDHEGEYFVTREMAARRNVLSREESLKRYVQPKSKKMPLERNIGEMKASAPPKGYFSLPFKPTVVPSYFSTVNDPDTGETYYRAWGDDYNTTGKYAHKQARRAMKHLSGVELGDNNEVLNKGAEYIGTGSDPMIEENFREYHFRGGEKNIKQFLEWRSDQSDGGQNYFDNLYMRAYGEHLSLDAVGRGRDSAWVAASRAYEEKYDMPPYYEKQGSYSMLKGGYQWPERAQRGKSYISYQPPPTIGPAFPKYPRFSPSASSGTPPPAAPASGTPASPPSSGIPIPPAGGGGTPPPDDPFDPMPETPEDPDDPGYNTEDEVPEAPGQSWEAVGRFPLTDSQRRAAESMRRGESVLVAMPPGSGKTEYAKLATVAARQHDPNKGITLMMTPSTQLNRSMAERLRTESGIEAYHMEGMPPYGQDKADYRSKRAQILQSIRQKTELYQTPQGEFKRRWKEGSPGVTLVMSPESAQNIYKTDRFGTLLSELTGMTIMDEGQEATKPGRPAMYNLRGTREAGGNSPTLIMGGTLSESAIEMYQRTQGISQENTFREPLGLGHIDFSLHVLRDPRQQNELAAQLSNAREGHSLTYAATTRDVEDIYLRQTASGQNSALIHEGEGGDIIGRLTKEQKDIVSDQVRSGEIQQNIVSSSVLGLGIDIRGMYDSEGNPRPGGGLSTVVNTGPSFLSDIVQRAARLRPVHSDPSKTVGKFHLIANPKQYEQWARSSVRDASTLASNPLDLARAYEYARHQTGYSLDYKVKGDQITQRLGEYLGGVEGGSKYSKLLGSTASSILMEAGLIKVEPGEIDDEMEMLTNFSVQDNQLPTGMSAEQYVADKITRSRYTDFSDHSRKQDYGQHLRNIGEYKGRELTAAASFFSRIQHLEDPQMSGRILRRGLETSNAGGVQGLENYMAVGINKDLANEYVKAVEGAIQSLREQESIGADMAKAGEAYTETVNKAANIIAGVPMENVSQAMRDRMVELEQTNPQMAASLGSRANTLMSSAAMINGVPQGAMGGGSFSQDDQGFGGTLYRSPYARGFYALMMGRRAWQYTGATVFQDMMSGAQDFTAPLMTDTPMNKLVGGYQSRLAASREAYADATYQNFGAFSEIGYALSGNQRATRLASSVGVGASIFSAGAMTGSELMFQGEFMKGHPMGDFMKGAGGLIFGASAIAGLGIIGAGAAIEGLNVLGAGQNIAAKWDSQSNALYNEYMGTNLPVDTTPRDLTLSDIPRRVVSTIGRPSIKLYGLDDNERFMNWVAGPQRSSEELNVQDFAKTMTEKLGGESADYMGAATSLTQVLPGDFGFNRSKIEGLLSTSRRSGMDQNALTSSLISTGAQYGFKPGDIGYSQILSQYESAQASGDPFRAISQIEADASRNYQFASQFSQYMPISQAAQLTSKYQLTEPGAARSGVGALEGAMAAGIDIDKVVETKLEKMYFFKKTGEQQTRTGEYEIPDPTAFWSFSSVPGKTQTSTTPVYETEVTYQPKDVTVADRLLEIQSTAREQFGNMAGQKAFDLSSGIASGLAGEAGYNEDQYTSLLSGLTDYFGAQGWTPNQYSLGQKILSGDIGAMSYATYTSQGTEVLNGLGLSKEESRFNDVAGRPIYKTSGTEFFNLGVAQGKYKKPTTDGLYQAPSYQQMADEMFGAGQVTNQGLLQAFFEQGTIGAQWNVSDQMYQIQQQSFALQHQQIDAARSYYGDSWGLQNRMRQMQYGSQMRQFGYQQERMELTHQFALEQDVITEKRMDTGKEYQQWQNSFQQQGMNLQQEWTRQDWQYQDTMRGLSYSWQSEDLEEAIRRSSGYERRQLVKQRERSSMTHSLEGEQVDEQRTRQEEMWKREQEAFDKKVEYQNTLMSLDEEQFEMNKSHREQLYEMEKEELQNRIKDYKQQFALQTQIENRSRQYQLQQLEFQEQALALQEQQADLQHQLEIASRDAQKEWETMMGTMSQAAQYGNLTKVFKNLADVGAAMAMIPNNKLNLYKEVFLSLGSLNSKAIKDFIEMLGYMQ